MEGIRQSLRAAIPAVACAALLLCAAACGEKEPPVFEDPLDDLAFEEQAKEAAHEFLAIAKANATKSCPRPVLRGTPLPGKATDDIIAVAETMETADACSAALDDECALELLDSYFVGGRSQYDGFPRRMLGTVAPLDDGVKRAPITDLLNVCAPELAHIEKAVAHEDACSPYLPGVRRVDDHVKYLDLGKLVASSAIERTRAGETREAVESLLDLIRFGQDFHRGGAPAVEAVLPSTASATAISTIEWILNRPEPLGAPLLSQIDRELAMLVESEPHPSEFLYGENVAEALLLALPSFFGSNWSPPGKVVAEPSETEDSCATDNLTARKLLVSLHKVRLAYAKSCKRDAPAVACHFRIEQLEERMHRSSWEGRNSPARWLDWITDPKAGPPNGENPFTLATYHVGAYNGYVQRHGVTRFYLGALRLLTRYRARVEETSVCPGIEAFDLPSFAEARTDPYTSFPLRVSKVGKGRFLIKSEGYIEAGTTPAIAIHVKCPFLIETKPSDDGGV